MTIDIIKVKIHVTIPESHTEQVRKAICNAGAGVLGEYTFCTTSVKSIGTFIPSSTATPYIGKNNELEIVNEDKLEVICDIKIAKKVVSELRKAHPYEEPAIDIVPLIDEDSLV